MRRHVKCMKNVLAIDFGASSGRGIIGSFDGERITLKEIHRFSNDPVHVRGTTYWDVLRLFHEIKQCIKKASAVCKLDSLGIDTWGVDFGLLDEDGRLLENPVHYRDSRTAGMMNAFWEMMTPEKLYEITGIQMMEFNTIFQLLSLSVHRPELLERADTLLMMPDLFLYFLSGIMIAEQSIASTTQLLDAKKGCWSSEVLRTVGISPSLFPYIVKSGTCIGTLSRDICRELHVDPISLIAVCGHDTQLAMAATPAEEKDFLFLSSGTWSLMGTELDAPLISEQYNGILTNELGYGEKTSLLKNIVGLWLIQESRRQWRREGKDYAFAQLEELAKQAQPFQSFVNPGARSLFPAGDIPQRIREYCKDTQQPIPDSVGAVMRCIYESLALKYRLAKEELEACTGKQYRKIYMVGGGVKDHLLAQFTANACGCDVSCGPVEATAWGNVAVQLLTQGALKDLAQARALIRQSESISVFHPEHREDWENAYLRYQEVAKLC